MTRALCTLLALLMLTGAGLLAWGTSAAGIRVVTSSDAEQFHKGAN